MNDTYHKPSDKEIIKTKDRYITELKNRITDLEQLRDAFMKLDVDNHYWGTRPCPTCREITALLGKPFGCNRESEEAKIREVRDG